MWVMESIKHLNVPVGLIKIVLVEKSNNAFKLFLFLKILGHRVKYDKHLILNIKKELNIKSEKTINKHLHTLIDKTWIGLSHNQNLFVRPFTHILKKENIKRKIRAEFFYRDFGTFDSFLAGAFIGHLSHYRYYQEKFKKRDEKECINGRSPQFSPSFYFPVASSAIAKMLNKSISNALRMKASAIKEGYILRKQNKIIIAENISILTLHSLKVSYGEESQRIKYQDNKAYILGPDLIAPTIHYKTRKK